jgi:hypothetical protein
VVRLGQEELLERLAQLERLDLLAPVDQVKIQFDIITLKNVDLKKKKMVYSISAGTPGVPGTPGAAGVPGVPGATGR